MPFGHHILFPIDFSDRSRSAVPCVVEMARQFRARITVLHVIDLPSGWYGVGDPGFPAMYDVPAIADSARERLEAFLGPAEPGMTVDYVFEKGEPAARIVTYASQHGAGLIMLPTHGMGTFRRLLLGSVTAKVLHDATCPVWTAAHVEDPQMHEHCHVRSILCAVGRKPESADIVRFAADLARSYQAPLRLVHAVAEEPGLVEYAGPEFHDALLRRGESELADVQRRAGTDLPVFPGVGPVPRVVHDAAIQYAADLVVIGRGRLHDTLGGLRSSAYGIIRESPCPVLSV